MLVTIPSDVSRGVVARSVAALAKGPNRVLGYVENMSGYYCRDCDAIKPLFAVVRFERISEFPASDPCRSIPSSRATAIWVFRWRHDAKRLSAWRSIGSRSG